MNHASWGRRLGALFIDWVASALVVVFISRDLYSSNAGGFYVLGVFWLQSSIGVALAGASFGQWMLGIRVLDVQGRPVTLLKALLRQALVCALIPPLVFQPDGRGLHDIWTRSGAWRVSR